MLLKIFERFILNGNVSGNIIFYHQFHNKFCFISSFFHPSCHIVCFLFNRIRRLWVCVDDDDDELLLCRQLIKTQFSIHLSIYIYEEPKRYIYKLRRKGKATKSDFVKPLDDGIIIISCLLCYIKVNKTRYESRARKWQLHHKNK